MLTGFYTEMLSLTENTNQMVFLTKFHFQLEKEALVKGVPIGQAVDIDIPPPRPKRKPSNPYPRKTSIGPTSQVAAKDGKLFTSVSLHCKQALDLEKEPLPEVISHFRSLRFICRSCFLTFYYFK